jgi:hypothetical protein
VLLALNGLDPSAFTANEKSEYLLAIQAVETLETFLVLWVLLKQFRPFPERWFNVDPRDDAFSLEKVGLYLSRVNYPTTR